MSTIKHTTTLPDGAVAKRSSKTRTYSHAVAAQKPAELLATELRKGIAYQAKLAADYREQARRLVDGEPIVDDRGRPYTWPEFHLPETWDGWAEGCESTVRGLTKALDNGLTDGAWFVTGWQSRYDLAVKEAGRWLKMGYRVEILEAVTA